MAKYIEAEKLKAEIERLRKLVVEDNYYLDNYEQTLGYGLALDDMGQFFDTLSEEPASKGYDEAYLNEKIAKASKTWEGVDVDKYMDEIRGREPDKSLEEEMDKFIETFGWGKTKHLAEKELISATARHFAKWQADHAPLPEDTVIFQKGIAEGKRLMLEEAVECSVYAGKEGDKWIVSYIGNYESMLKTCKSGDTVRIIIVNE